MLGYRPQYHKRFYYEANGTEVWRLPSANLYAAINMLLKLQVNIVTAVASNAPDFQIWNAIERIELVRDSQKQVWSMSGQAFALLFGKTHGTGVAAAANATIAGAVANDVAGEMYLSAKAYPVDTIKPWDFAIDTRAHDYELKIKWRDLTAVGTLFGTIGDSITLTDSENYLEVELDAIIPQANSINGQKDSLSRVTPLVVGLREDKLSVDASNTKFQIDIPDFQKYRNLILYTTHVANTSQEVGENDIIQNKITLYDTQRSFYQDIQAEMLRAKTSRRWGQGSNLNAGVYDLNLTAFGSALDVLVSNNVTDLYLDLDVVKQANNTYIRPIYVTQEEQGR